MEEVKDEWFKHFNRFLKRNKIYNEFMSCFREQKYERIHCIPQNQLLPNYIEIIKDYWKHSWYKSFGALFLTLDSFKWVNSNYDVPKYFTKKWCTICFKWGLYCIQHNIEICSMREFIRVVGYWNGNNWIDWKLITEEENMILNHIKLKYKLA